MASKLLIFLIVSAVVLSIILIFLLGFYFYERNNARVTPGSFFQSCSAVPSVTLPTGYLNYNISPVNYSKQLSEDLLTMSCVIDNYNCTGTLNPNFINLMNPGYQLFMGNIGTQTLTCFVGTDIVNSNIFVCWSSLYTSDISTGTQVPAVLGQITATGTPQVNGYIYSLYQTISSQVNNYILTNYITNGVINEQKQLCITGHGLGGSLAMLQITDVQVPGCNVYLFGSPSVGNQSFASQAKSYLDTNDFNLIQIYNLQDLLVYVNDNNSLYAPVSVGVMAFTLQNNADYNYANYQAYVDEISSGSCMNLDITCSSSS